MSMHELPPRLPTADEQWTDAFGREFVVGPTSTEADELGRLVSRWARYVGRIAMERGVGLEVMMGLLDGGLGLDEALDALVMHGELPDTAQQGEAPGRLQLTEEPSGWSVRVA